MLLKASNFPWVKPNIHVLSTCIVNSNSLLYATSGLLLHHVYLCWALTSSYLVLNTHTILWAYCLYIDIMYVGEFLLELLRMVKGGLLIERECHSQIRWTMHGIEYVPRMPGISLHHPDWKLCWSVISIQF